MRERGLVRGVRAFVFGRAVDVVEDAARQPPLRDAAQIRDGRGAAQAPLHRVGLDALEPDDRSERVEHLHGRKASAVAQM